MMARETLRERLISGRPLLMDGAVNTELSRKGLVFNTSEWLQANLDAPNAIAAIHGDYARAGAELHIANSFATGRHVLEQAGLADRFEALNRAAVRLCREAIDRAAEHHQWIAGSISTFAPDHDRNNLPDLKTLRLNVSDHACLLADAGCDMVALEMLFDVETSVAMASGAADCGLPVSLGLVCAHDAIGALVLEGSRDGRRGKANIPFDQALVSILDALPADADLIVAVMHSDLDPSAEAIAAIRRHWDGAIAVYPNNGHYQPPGGWDTSSGYDPAPFAAYCNAWLDQGVAVIGGCCGVGPAHIKALHGRFLDRSKAS